MTSPVAFTWDGETMRPKHPRVADKNFVIGEEYMLVEQNARSHASHAHYFAAVNEAWHNLPEALVLDFPTSEHLRKYALIKTGFCNSEKLVCKTEKIAREFAKFMQPCSEFDVVDVDGPVITRFTAQSQSMRAMGKEDFQRSKTAVLDYLASMIGTDTKTLEKAA